MATEDTRERFIINSKQRHISQIYSSTSSASSASSLDMVMSTPALLPILPSTISLSAPTARYPRTPNEGACGKRGCLAFRDDFRRATPAKVQRANLLFMNVSVPDLWFKTHAMCIHRHISILVPPLKVLLLSASRLSTPYIVAVEAALQWGNASVLSPAVVTRRAGSCFRPDDWDLGKFDANRTPAMDGTICCHLPRRDKSQ
jgi:hypothetical protein